MIESIDKCINQNGKVYNRMFTNNSLDERYYFEKSAKIAKRNSDIASYESAHE